MDLIPVCALLCTGRRSGYLSDVWKTRYIFLTSYSDPPQQSTGHPTAVKAGNIVAASHWLSHDRPKTWMTFHPPSPIHSFIFIHSWRGCQINKSWHVAVFLRRVSKHWTYEYEWRISWAATIAKGQRRTAMTSGHISEIVLFVAAASTIAASSSCAGNWLQGTNR